MSTWPGHGNQAYRQAVISTVTLGGVASSMRLTAHPRAPGRNRRAFQSYLDARIRVFAKAAKQCRSKYITGCLFLSGQTDDMSWG